ncbi:MAG: GNAT family N-acetyltransferase [Cytophagales bacterium]|nr:GNAT family N-acetyltransferase [Armatimonadota bacterium]
MSTVSAETSAPATAVTIRPATEQDYDAATTLFRSTMGAEYLLGRDLWGAVCTAPTHRALMAQDAAGTVVAMAIVVVSDRIRLAAGTRRRRYHLDELIVAPARRRQGIGRALLEHVKVLAQQDAPSYIIVNCDFMNVAARRSYESAGLYLVRQSADRFEVAFS